MTAPNAARPAYEWPQGKSSAFCFTIDVDAESPYQWSLPEGAPVALGQIEQRLFGPRVGIWRLLDLLDRYGIKATLFVPGLIAKNHPELLPTDYTAASLAGSLTALAEFGTHTVVLAATDQLGIDLPSIKAVKRVALAGGAPPASPAPCVVHQLAGSTLRTPATAGASLSKAGATIEFLAPGNWTDAGYRQLNGVGLHLHLAPVSGATAANSADVPLDLPALPVFTADNKVWLRYAGPLPDNLGTGAHVLSLVATAGTGSLTVTRQINLTA